jgi:hypothetical protein
MTRHIVLFGLLITGAALSARSGPITFTATASVSSPAKKAAVPITIHIDRFNTDAERDTVAKAVRANDHPATLAALAALPDIGYISLSEKRTPLKYAYERPTGHGRLVTVVTAKPVFFVGGAAAGAKPKQGYDLGLALLVLNEQDTGDGELAPAVKIKVDNNGAIVTEDYGTEKVHLVKIAKVR